MNRDELVRGKYYWAIYLKDEDKNPEIVYYGDIYCVDRIGSDDLYRLHDFEFLKEVEPYES